VRAAVKSGEMIVIQHMGRRGRIPARLVLSGRERRILLAGGLLNLIKQQKGSSR
jgi:hypothetical protein